MEKLVATPIVPPERSEEWTVSFTANTHDSPIHLDSNFGLLLRLSAHQNPNVTILTYCCGLAPFPTTTGVVCIKCGEESDFPSDWLFFNAGSSHLAFSKILSALKLPDSQLEIAVSRLENSVRALNLYHKQFKPHNYKRVLQLQSGRLFNFPNSSVEDQMNS